MNITVVGMGKIGLPLAAQYASKGHRVFGADVNEKTVDKINKGIVPFPGEPTLDKRISSAVRDGLLEATLNTAEAVSNSQAVVVVVPLFVDAIGTPDFGLMDNATRDIAKGLRPGTLVSYETTLPVGTTKTRFAPMLEEISGLKEGRDFYVAFSPERVLTGRVFEDLRKYPKLIGGISPESAQSAVNFYNSVLDFDPRPDLARENGVWDLGSSEASEMAKLAETTYRDVNIGLANQFARFADTAGIDIYQVIEACNSQFFSHIHQPGIAVGGHCIPIYPQMYLWNDPSATVVRAAREANKSMPAYAVALLEGKIGSLNKKTVAVLGAAYRGGVKETAFSGVFDVVESLKAAGAVPKVHDPMYTDDELIKLGFEVFHLGDSCDAAILQSNHEEYQTLTAEDVLGAEHIIDGRKSLTKSITDSIETTVLGSASY